MVLELPSEVKDRNFVSMPLQEKLVESDEEWSKYGKWILMNRAGNISWVDKTWISLQVLLENGTLLMVKASTAKMENEDGTVICYTRPGIEEIKQAAEAIRKIVSYNGCMFYKINSATENGISALKGDKHISIYMHTFRGFLYSKLDQTEEWILEGDLQSLRPPLSSEKAKAILKLDENYLHLLPSRTRKMFLTANNKSSESDCNFYIHAKCSMKKEEHGLTEADRLWIIGKKMMERGDFKKIFCFNKQHKPSQKIIAEFRFYYTKYLPHDKNLMHYKHIVELCDTLRRKAHFYGFLYFVTPMNKVPYKYTPDGELYENEKFVEL